MAVEDIYIRLKVDTKQFDTSMTGIKKEMATLKGLIGNSLLSKKDNDALKSRFGELKNNLDDIRYSAEAIDTGDVFGNMARFSSVAANAVAGVSGAMALLGVETNKVGEIEKQILSFMAIGNALQAVADSKRLRTLAEIYGAKLKELFITRQIKAEEVASGGVTGGGGAIDTTDIAEANAAANITQAASINQISDANAKLAATQMALYDNIVAERDILIDINKLGIISNELVDMQNGKTQEQIDNIDEMIQVNDDYVTALDEQIEVLRTGGKVDKELINNVKAHIDVKARSLNIVDLETRATEANTIATEVNNAAQAQAIPLRTRLATAAAPAITAIRTMTAAVWKFTLSLLSNPIVWFAAAIAIVVISVKALINGFKAQEIANKKVNAALKETLEYLKDIEKQTKTTTDSLAGLYDDLAVKMGKMTEADKKKNDLKRKYDNENIKLEEERIKALKELTKKFDDGEIKTTALFFGMIESINIRHKILMRRRQYEYNAQMRLINEEERQKTLLDQQQELEKQRQLYKQHLDKIKEMKIQSEGDLANLQIQSTQALNRQDEIGADRDFYELKKKIRNEYIQSLEQTTDYDKIIEIDKWYRQQLVLIETEERDNLIKVSENSEFEKTQALIKAYNDRMDQLKKKQDEINATSSVIGNTEQVKMAQVELNKVIEGTEIVHQQQLKQIQMEGASDRTKIKEQSNKNILDIEKKYITDDIKLQNDRITIITSQIDRLESLKQMEGSDVRKITNEQISSYKSMIPILDQVYKLKLKEIAANLTGADAVNAQNIAYEEYLKSLTDIDLKINEVITEQTQLFQTKQEQSFQNALSYAQRGLDYFTQFAQISMDTASQTIDDIFNKTMRSISDEYEGSMEMIDDALEYGLISQETYDQRKDKLDKERENKEIEAKKVQAASQKEQAIFSAILATASAIINALQSPPPASFIFSATAAAIGAAQISAIKSQPLPEFAIGGPVYGPSHISGGKNINVEGGEYIINKNSANRVGMRPVLDSINAGTYKERDIDTDLIYTIVDSVVKGVSAIPVQNVESDMTRVQRKVSNIEKRASW